jgi:hypothetical protein
MRVNAYAARCRPSLRINILVAEGRIGPRPACAYHHRLEVVFASKAGRDRTVILLVIVDLVTGHRAASNEADEGLCRQRAGIPVATVARLPFLGSVDAEQADALPAELHGITKRRCLVPATGWYEWQDVGEKKKRPMHMRPMTSPFAFAGVWDVWKGDDGPGVISFSIVTTTAAPSVSQYHSRMPVVLDDHQFDEWMRGTSTQGCCRDCAAQFRKGRDAPARFNSDNTRSNLDCAIKQFLDRPSVTNIDQRRN